MEVSEVQCSSLVQPPLAHVASQGVSWRLPPSARPSVCSRKPVSVGGLQRVCLSVAQTAVWLRTKLFVAEDFYVLRFKGNLSAETALVLNTDLYSRYQLFCSNCHHNSNKKLIFFLGL